MRSSSQKILRSTALIMGLTLLAKVTGLIRDIIVASHFGTSQTMDAFFVAVTIATLMYVWLKDPIQVVLVPFFTEQLATRGESLAWESTSGLLTTLFILFWALAGIGWFVSPYLVRLIAPGFTDEMQTLPINLTRFMMFSFLFYGLARLLSALFYAHQRFGMPGMTTAVDNVVVILLIALLVPPLGIYTLVLANIIGAAAQVLVQIPILWKNRAHFRPRLDFKNPALRHMVWVSTPLLIGTGSAELSRISDRIFASLLPIGSLSALAYGNRLTYATFFQLFVGSLTTVLFPFFSRSAVQDNREDLGRKLFRSLRILFWVVLPLSTGIVLLNEPLVRLVYQRGAFSEESVRLTSQAVFYYAIGLSGYSLSVVLSYAFYSVQETKTPVVTGIIRLGVKLLLSFALVGSMAHAGLALAESASFIVKAILLLFLLPKELRQEGYHKVLLSFGVTGLMTVGMAAMVIVCLPYLRQFSEVNFSFATTATLLGTCAGLGAGSYFLFSLLVQRAEVRDIYRLVRAGFAKS